ncbi:MAG: ABC transporter ATP-binding protein [Lachnospiraceae bacterium]|nr:ABC transporter ATP-binding protein [Lachnospiraceae bacterium]
MIEVTGITKKYEDIPALQGISLTIQEGAVFGLVGTNGAGKSTFLRILAGILKQDDGEVRIDEEGIYENERNKQNIFFISDDQYFFSNTTPEEMKIFYANLYPLFDEIRFDKLMQQFELDAKRKINTFSKGMKKQVSVILGICANTKYILCDETFDGLDPVMRQAVKSLFISEIENRKLTPIIASHNLRELEDICDYVGVLHKGGVLLSRDLEDLKLNLHKVQCVFNSDKERKDFVTEEAISIVKTEMRGSLYTFTIRGDGTQLENILATKDMIFSEILPLSLEEIFISETEVVGYDIKKLIY